MDHPISTTYLDHVLIRPSAVLAAGGAWDATPREPQCPGFNSVVFAFTYTRGGAGGAFDFKIEVSTESTGTVWHQLGLYSPAVLVAGADSQSREQREYITYEATGAADELFVYGGVDLEGAIERIRINARESGNVGAPGTLEIKARFA